LDIKKILGLEICSIDKFGALTLIEANLKNRVHHKVAFVNANLANLVSSDSKLLNKLQSFILLNDGSGMSLATKLLKYDAFPDNLNGTDFTPYFLDNINLKLKVFLLGSIESVAEKSAETFKEKWPQHSLVGFHHGFFDDQEFAQVLLKIKASKADIVFVGMGNPIQENIADKLVPDYVLSAWCIGACFEFISNQLPRSPIWMRKLGIEWLYRLILEPKRLWKRYLIGNFIFIYHVLKQKFKT
jgi:exopolysaccharide biosynthesis WecB/TagA/CpsF family protein